MGNIILWSTGDTFRQIIKISGEGDPCSSIGLWNDLIIGGYGSGHLRVYSATTGKMCVEASAHAKWITAIDVAKSTGLILSASEDTFARVWKLSSGSNVKMELVHSETIADLQLQGAKFISEDGRAFACTGYDSNEIHFFTKA
ncbi:hypothetical protein CAPTEDRAFT_224382 [Capitella teleta]|uniref:WD repeat-containing protein 54 beta-propeller domain-containing protein n=1 Tax=Capitella teleta TaxID=283909 RepID=R7VH08_CAPTE|nr:hypothetical protein CAPTEDRAFT_224382 [Capitella teleta]|eukprot:ELU17852.1 hypothetical protein CAPTEDRAFT_224382 [Capitella teleta]